MWQPYPAYRDSGIGWIGDVPEDWGTVAIKRACSRVTDGSHHSPAAIESGGMAYVTVRDLKGNKVDVENAARISHDDFRALERAGCRPQVGDVLFSKDGTVGKVALVQRSDFVVLSSLAILRPSKTMSGRFLAWFLRSTSGEKQIESRFAGAALRRITLDAIVDLQLPLPPADDQHAVSDFLDRETAKIDGLIEKKRRLIELLREKRQALISHAVTRGLNPDAPMKDSGIEWLGEVPVHWDVMRLRHAATVQTGLALGRKLPAVETTSVPYLRVANVQDGYLSLDNVANVEATEQEVQRYQLQLGDVLMNEGGDYDKLGRGAIWTGEIEPCLHQNHVFAVRTTKMLPKWLAAITATSYAKWFFVLRSKQSTNLASISSSNVKELPLVCPPEAEQRAILKALADEVEKLDRVQRAVELAIERLQEHRSALISAAVTGKIDVRGLVEEAAA
jgi:type I restriction enzyme S subunit